MSKIGTFEAEQSTAGYAPDGIWREWAVDLRVRAHSFREFRDALLAMAYWLERHEENRGVLLLIGSRISRARLDEELSRAEKVLRSDVFRRIHVLSISNRDRVESIPENLGLSGDDRAKFRSWIKRLVTGATRRRKPRDAFDLVFEVLLNQWMLNEGPMTTKWIMKTTGFSYPPIAKALERLGPALTRHTDRRVELAYFPRNEWSRYLGAAERSGFGYRYQASSNLARSADAMLRRLQDMTYPELSISGIHAARHYVPDLDLVGSPRLDLCVHSPLGVADLGFVKALDPALKRSGSSSDRSPALVIWPVYRDQSLFRPNPRGMAWSDPVSCLLALHDARLEPQADEFLNAFKTSRERLGLDD